MIKRIFYLFTGSEPPKRIEVIDGSKQDTLAVSILLAQLKVVPNTRNKYKKLGKQSEGTP